LVFTSFKSNNSAFQTVLAVSNELQYLVTETTNSITVEVVVLHYFICCSLLKLLRHCSQATAYNEKLRMEIKISILHYLSLANGKFQERR